MIKNVSTLGLYHTNKSIVHTKLTKIMKDNSDDITSRYYLLAAKEMDKKYGGINSDGEKIEFDKIKDELKSKFYRNIYEFDDGKLIIKAGDTISYDSIIKLYWGTKEVDSRFFRQLGTDEILEEKKHNTAPVTIIIYNNYKEYTYAEFLNDISTDNGGICIGQDKTLYTFNRYKSETEIYSLEDIVKHEYTHFLQAEYIIHDNFGEGLFYENNMILVYQEGEAEYFMGSTRTSGVIENKEIADFLIYDFDNNLNKKTILEILGQDYSDGYYLYRYGYSFMNYAIKSNPDVYGKIVGSIRENDFEAYNKYLEFLKTDEKTEKEYEDNLNRIKNVKDLPPREISDIYLQKHDNRAEDDILKDLALTTGVEDLKYKVIESGDFETIILEGVYKSSIKSKGKILDNLEMDKITDEMLLNLTDLAWSGYETFTAYFKNHRIDSENNAIYDIVFHGIKNTK